MSTTSIEQIEPERVHVSDLPAATSRTAPAYERASYVAGDPGWLSAGQFAELDRLREAHHRHIRQVNEAARAWREARSRLRDAEEARRKAAEHAMRTGEPVPAGEHPSEAEREAELGPLVENVHAAIVALAAFAEEVIGELRRREDEWVAELIGRLPEVERKREQAARLLEEARADEWRIDRMARWVQQTSDDLGFAPVPPDAAGPPPASWRPNPAALRRPWHQKRPWNEKTAEEAAALEGPKPQGPASPAGASSMVPLSESEKYDHLPGGGEAA